MFGNCGRFQVFVYNSRKFYFFGKQSEEVMKSQNFIFEIIRCPDWMLSDIDKEQDENCLLVKNKGVYANWQ